MTSRSRSPIAAIDRRKVLAASLGLVAAGPLTLARAYAAGGRVLHIDSYHKGNEWNDRIAAALVATLTAAGVEVRVIHLDTKRRSSEEEMRAAGRMAMEEIAAYRPDVVTTSDDNAITHVVMPYLRDGDIPVVFCGLNWDASVYGLPYRNTTGMVEVSPIPQLIRLLRPYAAGERLGLLTEDTETKHKEKAFHERLFGIEYARTWFVSTYPEWREAFVRAQDEVDILILLGVGALTDWDDSDARRLAETATRVPSGTDFEWLMPYALLGVVKEPEEQGEWAAKAALRILDGVEPRRIPIAYNKRGRLIFHRSIADRLGVTTPPPPLASVID